MPEWFKALESMFVWAPIEFIHGVLIIFGKDTYLLDYDYMVWRNKHILPLIQRHIS